VTGYYVGINKVQFFGRCSAGGGPMDGMRDATLLTLRWVSLVRAADKPVGRDFESLRARHINRNASSPFGST